MQPEVLRNENAYKCSHCNKKVAAEKRFTLHRAPNIATFQLKRFDYNRIFGGKINKQISYPEALNLRPYMSENKGEPVNYKLFAVIVHVGGTSTSGHYFCYVRNSSKGWYLMDDSRVMPKGLNEVLNQQAYILFYVRTPTKVPINRSDSLLAHKDNSTNLTNNYVNKLSITINNKPNGLIPKDKIDVSTKKINFNLPKMIIENNVNTKKQNGDLKSVNSNNSSTNNTSNKSGFLSEINSKLNSNLIKLSSKLSNQQSNNKLDDAKDSKTSAVKRLVPYDNNSSDDDSSNSSNSNKRVKLENGSAKKVIDSNNQKHNQNDDNSLSDEEECKNKTIVNSVTKHLENHIQSNNEKDKKLILNGFAKFAESIGSLFNGNEDELLKQIETMPKEIIEFSNGTKSNKLNKTPIKSPNNMRKSINNNSQSDAQNNSKQVKTPSKTDELKKENNQTQQPALNKVNQQLVKVENKRPDSPVKLNGHLSNVYYQAKAATNQLANLNNKWVVGESPSKCKTSSITSGSSTNSINSTTEWQVIDRDSSASNSLRLKKNFNRNSDNSWKVADLGSHSSDSDDESKNSYQQKNLVRTSNSKQNHNNSNEDEELTYIERRFKKKLERLAKKNEKKYKELIADKDARLKLYLKTKQKCKKRKERDGLEDRKNKKHRKKHKKDKFRNESFQDADESNDDRLKNSNQNSNQSLTENSTNGKVISQQKNGDFNHYAKLLSKASNGKNNDVKNELDKMHLSFLGNNGIV